MKQIQFIGYDPQTLRKEIADDFTAKIAQLKKEFQPKHPTEFLTRKETAQLLKINLATLWAWTKKGKLQSYGMGNKVYYKRAEVEQAFIEL